MKKFAFALALLTAQISVAEKVDKDTIVTGSGTSFNTDSFNRILDARNEASREAYKKCTNKGYTEYRELSLDWSNWFGVENSHVKMTVQCK